MAQHEMNGAMPRGILVFGSINIDLICHAERIPLPGETMLAPSYNFFAGGKGANQAVAAARAGASVVMVGAVGRDAFAEIPIQAMNNSGVDTHAVRSVEVPTGAAFITVSKEGENAITVASGANRMASAAMIGDAEWAASQLLLMQGELDWTEACLAGETAQAKGLTVVLNAAPSQNFNSDIMPFVDYLIINVHEMADIAERNGFKPSGLNQFAGRILQKPKSAVIVTRGAQGVEFFSDAMQLSVAAQPVEVVDTTGAGDTFCGVFCAMLVQGRDAEVALRMANIAGGLACTRRGAQSAMPDLAAIEATALCV